MKIWQSVRQKNTKTKQKEVPVRKWGAVKSDDVYNSQPSGISLESLNP